MACLSRPYRRLYVYCFMYFDRVSNCNLSLLTVYTMSFADTINRSEKYKHGRYAKLLESRVKATKHYWITVKKNNEIINKILRRNVILSVRSSRHSISYILPIFRLIFRVTFLLNSNARIIICSSIVFIIIEKGCLLITPFYTKNLKGKFSNTLEYFLIWTIKCQHVDYTFVEKKEKAFHFWARPGIRFSEIRTVRKKSQ